jgi:hypothetical protein
LSLVPSLARADQSLAGNVTITGGASTGNLAVTGAIDSDSNTFTFGTQGASFGAALQYQDNSTDTFTFSTNRNPASWLWVHSTAVPAMRLDSAHQLILYQSNGTTAGVTLTPASNQLSLGTATLTATGAVLSTNGAFSAGGTLTATGALTAPSAIFTSGLNGTPIGNTTSSTGVFTTLTATTSLTTPTIFTPSSTNLTFTPSTGYMASSSSSSTMPQFELTNTDNGSSGGSFRLRKSRTSAATAVSDSLGRVVWSGRDTAASNYWVEGASVSASALAVTSTYVQGQLKLSTTDNAGTSGSRMLLDSASAVISPPLTLSASTASTSTASGALIVTGGVGIGENLYLGKKLVASPTGLTHGSGYTQYHSISVSGAGDAGGLTDIRGFTLSNTITGANAVGNVDALNAYPTHSGSGVVGTLTGSFVIPQLTSTGSATSAFGYRTYPNLTGSGNITGSWTAFQASSGTYASTGNITGMIWGFRVDDIGRVAATELNAVDVSDQTKGSGNAMAFRGRMSSGTGKYNLYLDGTAANVIAGQTTITDATPSTSTTTGALVVNGGVGIAGNLSVAGTFSSANLGATTLTGGATGLTLASGGTGQNITLSPNGAGSTILNGNVGVGTTSPLSKLSINGGLHVGGDSDAGDNNLLVDGTITGGASAFTTLNATGLVSLTNTTAATDFSTAAVVLSGGLAVAKKGFFGDRVSIKEAGTTTIPADTGDMLRLHNQGFGGSIMGEGAGASFGGRIQGRLSSGTFASPAATPSASVLLRMSGSGYGAAYANNKALLDLMSLNSWSGTDNSTQLRLQLTPAGGTTPTTVGIWDATGLAVTGAVTTTGNVGIGTATPAAPLDVAGRTIKLSNLQPEYRLDFGGGSDLTWKTIANVTLGSGLFVGTNFIVKILDADNNYGVLVSAKALTYYVAMTRSGGVQDDSNSAQVSGPSNEYARVVKTATGVYELQVRQPADWKKIIVTAQAYGINSLGAGGTVAYATTPVNGSTGGTIYTPSSAHTDYFTGGYFSGNVGIGTTNPGAYKLAVKGKIRAEEIVVDTGWADYVFEDDYRLAPLAEVESHIKAKKHLPGIPSAAEVAEHGVSMGDMQSKLLSKVEELTLHLIAQEKELAALRREVSALKTSASNP